MPGFIKFVLKKKNAQNQCGKRLKQNIPMYFHKAK